MTGPLLHLPTLVDVMTLSWTAIMIFAMDFAFALAFNHAPRFVSTFNVVFPSTQILIRCLRDDVRWPVLLALLVLLISSRFPWDKWGNRLKAWTSSITAVAAAAFKRQQAEAFS